jgi:hypothetical protein
MRMAREAKTFSHSIDVSSACFDEEHHESAIMSIMLT